MSDTVPTFALNVMILTFDSFYLIRNNDVAGSHDLEEFVKSGYWTQDDTKGGWTCARTVLVPEASAPILSLIEPPSAEAGQTVIDMILTGANFAGVCELVFGSTTYSATRVSDTEMSASGISAAEFAEATNVNVLVKCDGVASSSIMYPLTAPA